MEVVSCGAIPNSFGAALHSDGLDCSNRSQAAVGGRAVVRNSVVARWRVVLHRRGPLLRSEARPVQSRDLARVRDGRKHLSLLCGNVLRAPRPLVKAFAFAKFAAFRLNQDKDF